MKSASKVRVILNDNNEMMFSEKKMNKSVRMITTATRSWILVWWISVSEINAWVIKICGTVSEDVNGLENNHHVSSTWTYIGGNNLRDNWDLPRK